MYLYNLHVALSLCLLGWYELARVCGHSPDIYALLTKEALELITKESLALLTKESLDGHKWVDRQTN